MRNINFIAVDQDQSVSSRQLIQKIDASAYFKLVSKMASYSEAVEEMDRGKTDIIIDLGNDFERSIIRESHSTITIQADAVNGVKAGLGVNYLVQIIADFNQDIRTQMIPIVSAGGRRLEVKERSWYNPHFNYHWFMVPGILAILVTMVGSFLAALNIVAEKEGGTIEQINVTPVNKIHFILGKLIPFWILGLVSISLGMVVAWLVYGMIPAGGVLAILGFAAIYLLAVLGIGLLISTMADNQQQATLIAFFVMMIFILMGGLFTPVESMPSWARWVASLNPPTYFIKAVRSIYLMGSSLWDLRMDILITVGFAGLLQYIGDIELSQSIDVGP